MILKINENNEIQIIKFKNIDNLKKYNSIWFQYQKEINKDEQIRGIK